MLDQFTSMVAGFSLFWEYKAVMLPGLWYNFLVFFLVVVFGIVLGLAFSTIRLSTNIVLRAIGTFYTGLFRNAPEYVMLVWFFYVPALLLTKMLGGNVTFEPLVVAVMALSLSSGAFYTEIFRAGILSVPKGHVEAARGMGMSRTLTLRRIILPQAVRQMLPEFFNECISVFKATTLVSLVMVPDLVYGVNLVSSYTGQALPLYTGVALIYFAIVFAMTTIAEKLSNPWRDKGN
ncbi:MAG TPA: amino acid ABC transporter permease [Gammaproteobacteria bacterium]|nr:amino acid ABC transporter permease [Gammaproteobacteria bacterium]